MGGNAPRQHGCWVLPVPFESYYAKKMLLKIKSVFLPGKVSAAPPLPEFSPPMAAQKCVHTARVLLIHTPAAGLCRLHCTQGCRLLTSLEVPLARLGELFLHRPEPHVRLDLFSSQLWRTVDLFTQYISATSESQMVHLNLSQSCSFLVENYPSSVNCTFSSLR